MTEKITPDELYAVPDLDEPDTDGEHDMEGPPLDLDVDGEVGE